MTSAQQACPGCGRAVINGVQLKGAAWHEDCAARALVAEADAQAQPPAAAEPARPRRGSCLKVGLSVLFDFFVPILASAFMGALAGGAAGLYLGVVLWRDRPPWPLVALAAGALLGGAAGLAAGLRFFWEQGELYGFGGDVERAAGKRSRSKIMGGPK